MPLITHIAEIPTVRKITFETRRSQTSNERERRRLQSRERADYSQAWHARRRREGRKAEGSGQIAGLTYRAQLARQALAQSHATIDGKTAKQRKRRRNTQRAKNGQVLPNRV